MGDSDRLIRMQQFGTESKSLVDHIGEHIRFLVGEIVVVREDEHRILERVSLEIDHRVAVFVELHKRSVTLEVGERGLEAAAIEFDAAAAKPSAPS